MPGGILVTLQREDCAQMEDWKSECPGGNKRSRDRQLRALAFTAALLFHLRARRRTADMSCASASSGGPPSNHSNSCTRQQHWSSAPWISVMAYLLGRYIPIVPSSY